MKYLPRETMDMLEAQGVDHTDNRWFLVCNYPSCRNILHPDEHLVCEEHDEKI